MPTKYLILRADEDLDEAIGFTKSSDWNKQKANELSLLLYDGHETDLGELRADPKNAFVVDAEINLSLVAPTATGPATAANFGLVGTLQMPAGLPAVGAHTSPFTGQGVTVAVLDTGIDASHQAFAGKTMVTRNFIGDGRDSSDVADANGHGTHCAGTICGGDVDGVRVGVAPGVTKLCVGKVLGVSGGTLEGLLDAMYWAVVEEQASVVSMSLSYDLPGNSTRLIKRGVDPSLATQVALRHYSDISDGITKLRAYLGTRVPGLTIVAATGNDSVRPDFVIDASLPAAKLFSVGAVELTQNGKWRVAGFSNGRATVVAPGVDVVSAAVGGGWATMNGTSMATPHVAGVAALWLQKLRRDGHIGVSESVASALRSYASHELLVDSDRDAVGYGMVQAPQT